MSKRSAGKTKSGKVIRPYSVLLMYPPGISEGHETYYDFVKAKSTKNAIKLAQRNLIELSSFKGILRTSDFRPLLVINGHHSDRLINTIRM